MSVLDPNGHEEMSLIEPTFFERNKALCIIGGLVLLLVIGGLAWWAFSGGGKDETPLITNIGIDNGREQVINGEVTNQEGRVNNATNNFNQAVNALNNSISKPSNQFNGAGAGSRFCHDFPDDPSCR